MRLPLDRREPPPLAFNHHIGCTNYSVELEARMRRLWDINIETGKILSVQWGFKEIKGSVDVHGHLWVSLRLGATQRVKIRISRLIWRCAKGYWPNFPLKHLDLDLTNNSIHNLDRAEDGYQQRKQRVGCSGRRFGFGYNAPVSR